MFHFQRMNNFGDTPDQREGRIKPIFPDPAV